MPKWIFLNTSGSWLAVNNLIQNKSRLNDGHCWCEKMWRTKPLKSLKLTKSKDLLVKHKGFWSLTPRRKAHPFPIILRFFTADPDGGEVWSLWWTDHLSKMHLRLGREKRCLFPRCFAETLRIKIPGAKILGHFWSCTAKKQQQKKTGRNEKTWVANDGLTGSKVDPKMVMASSLGSWVSRERSLRRKSVGNLKDNRTKHETYETPQKT